MINAQMKDYLLEKLVNGNLRFRLNTDEVAEDLKCNSSDVIAILEYFERKKIIEAFIYAGNETRGRVRVEAYDLYHAGGYVAQEELLENNIKKLLLEIESLKPSMPDKINKISTIAANIVTALSLFTK